MRNIAVFFFMLIFMWLYTYYLGGETSMLMLYMLLISPPLSFLITYPLRKSIDISVEVPSSEVEKDGTIMVVVTIANRTFMPVPYIDIVFMKPGNLKLSVCSSMKVFLAPYEKRAISVKYNALYRGVSEIGVEDIVLRDYLGFFSFSLLKKFEEYERLGRVTVLPRIVNMKLSSKIMLSSGKTNVTDDGATSSAGLFSWSGEPGHEFREYEAGDPLHKIHWKLSAMSEKLMVRKNEGGGVPKKRLIIDPLLIRTAKKDRNKTLFKTLFKKLFKTPNKKLRNIESRSFLPDFLPGNGTNKSDNELYDDDDRLIEERILESVLSVANMLFSAGRPVEFWVYEDGQWQYYMVSDRKDIINLQHRLAAYHFIDDSSLSPHERMPVAGICLKESKNRSFKGGEAVVFTGYPDSNLKKSIEGLADYDMFTDMIVIKKPSDTKGAQDEKEYMSQTSGQGNLWVLTTEEDITEALI